MFSAIVLPVAVRREVFINPPLSSSFITAGIPPALYKSSI